MANQCIGEIRMFTGNYAPRGWAFCEGQILSISSNEALYSILGTMYGGNGQTTFALPDLRGRVPVHIGGPLSITRGQRGGAETHTLTMPELPMHTHPAVASTNDATEISPVNNVWAAKENCFGIAQYPMNSMNSQAVSSGGGGQAHNNMQPYLVVNFIIALEGMYPSRN